MEKNTNTKRLKQNITDLLKTTPGLVRFSPILEEEKDSDIKCLIENNHIDVSIGLIISKNVSTKSLFGEIKQALSQYFKNKQKLYLLGKVNIYIKGVE